jgi:hypothetical protein
MELIAFIGENVYQKVIVISFVEKYGNIKI